VAHFWNVFLFAMLDNDIKEVVVVVVRGKRFFVGIATFLVSFPVILELQMVAVDAAYVAHAYVIGQTPFSAILSFEPGIDPIPYEWAWMILVGLFSLMFTFIGMNIYDQIRKGGDRNEHNNGWRYDHPGRQ
jgi:hypothetical protein